MTIAGVQIDLSAVLGLLATIITGLLTLLATWLRRKIEAETNHSKAELAGLKVAALVTTLAGRAWDRLSPKLQMALADGKITPEERLEIEKDVGILVADFTSTDDLKALAEALGLPLSGLIAKIASMLIGVFTSAHDPTIESSKSALEFPVNRPPDPLPVPESAWTGP